MSRHLLALIFLIFFDKYLLSQQRTYGETGDAITVRIMSNPENFNPIISNDASAYDISKYVFQTLNTYNETTQEMEPMLAYLPEISNDGLIYKYQLKKNVHFSDGVPLTEKDVIFSLKLIKNPSIENTYNYYLNDVDSISFSEGYLVFYVHKKKWRSSINLGAFPVVPKHVWDPGNITDKYSFSDIKAGTGGSVNEYADYFNSSDFKFDFDKLIGSGPYIYEKFMKDTAISLKRDKNYWDIKDNPSYLQKILFLIIPNDNVVLEALKMGVLDFSYIQNVDSYSELLKEKSKYMLNNAEPSEPSYTYMAWNENNPIFKDSRTRWALSYLIDRQAILKTAKNPFAVLIQSPVHFIQEKYVNKDLPVIEYNPEKALEILKDAGWNASDNNGILEKEIDGKIVEFSFTITVNNAYRKSYARMMSNAFRKAGIAAEVEELEWNSFLDKISSGNYDASYGAWSVSVLPPDPSLLWHSKVTTSSTNPIYFVNSRSDEMLEKYEVEFDEAERIKILYEWQKLIYDEQPYTFLYSVKARYLYSDRFENNGWSNTSYDFSRWWVKKEKQKYKF